MQSIDINNLTPYKIDSKFLKQSAKKVLEAEKSEKDLSIVIVSSEAMQELNNKYRKKNEPTDVLSFDYGEIAICPEVVGKNAKKFHLSYNKEMVHVLIHGILHILGYDHEGSEKDAKIMQEKTEKYLSELNFVIFK